MSNWITATYQLPEDDDWLWDAIIEARPDLSLQTVMHLGATLRLRLSQVDAARLMLAIDAEIAWHKDHFVIPDNIRGEVNDRLSEMSCLPEWRVERIAEFASESAMVEFEEAMNSVAGDSARRTVGWGSLQ